MEKINLKAGEKFCVVHLDTDTGHVVAAPALGVQVEFNGSATSGIALACLFSGESPTEQFTRWAIGVLDGTAERGDMTLSALDLTKFTSVATYCFASGEFGVDVTLYYNPASVDKELSDVVTEQSNILRDDHSEEVCDATNVAVDAVVQSRRDAVSA